MSKDTEDDQHVLPAEQDLASTGAAADSAEPDEQLKALPRLLRSLRKSPPSLPACHWRWCGPRACRPTVPLLPFSWTIWR
jgi:hypothetical protein